MRYALPFMLIFFVACATTTRDTADVVSTANEPEKTEYQKVYEKAGFSAHLRVQFEGPKGVQTSIISGFLFDGRVFTAGHAFIADRAIISIHASFLGEPNTTYEMVLLAANGEKDVALLGFVGRPPKVPGAVLAPYDGVKRDDVIYAIGSSGAVAPFFMSRGVVRHTHYKLFKILNDQFEYHDEHYQLRLLHNAFVLGGNSGGPVLDTQGRVVGMTIIGLRKQEADELFQVAVGVPSNELLKWFRHFDFK